MMILLLFNKDTTPPPHSQTFLSFKLPIWGWYINKNYLCWYSLKYNNNLSIYEVYIELGLPTIGVDFKAIEGCAHVRFIFSFFLSFSFFFLSLLPFFLFSLPCFLFFHALSLIDGPLLPTFTPCAFQSPLQMFYIMQIWDLGVLRGYGSKPPKMPGGVIVITEHEGRTVGSPSLSQSPGGRMAQDGAVASLLSVSNDSWVQVKNRSEFMGRFVNQVLLIWRLYIAS